MLIDLHGELFIELSDRLECERLLAERACGATLTPVSNALRVEVVANITG